MNKLLKADSLYQAEAYNSALHYYREAWAYHTKNGGCKEAILAQTGASLMTGLLREPSLAKAQLIGLQDSITCCAGYENVLQAHIRQALALLYNKEREFDRAVHEQEKALAGFIQTYGDRHPTVIRSYYLLGDTYLRMEQYQHADSLLHQVLDLSDHLPDSGAMDILRGMTHISLGNNYERLRNYAEAQRHHKKALALFQRHLPGQHPSIAKSFLGIADSFSRLGELDHAMDYYEKSLAIQMLAFGQDSPTVAKTLGRIGIVYFRKGQWLRARDYFSRSLNIQKCQEINENLQLQLVSTLSRLGIVAGKLETPDCALEYYHEALQMVLAMKNPSIDRILTIYSNIVSLYQELKDYDSALSYQNETFKLIKKISDGENNLRFGTYYLKMAHLYLMKRQFVFAETYARRALKIHLDHLGPDHPDIVTCYMALGTSCMRQKVSFRAQEAFDYFQKALTISLNHLGEEHNITGYLYSRIGEFYEMNDQFDSAIHYLKKGNEIRAFSKQNPTLAEYYFNLGGTYYNATLLNFKTVGGHDNSGLLDSALHYFHLAVQVQEEMYGFKSPDISNYYNALGKAYFTKLDWKQSIQAYELAIAGNMTNKQRKLNASFIDPENYYDGDFLLASMIGKAQVLSKLGTDPSTIIKMLRQCDQLIRQLRQSNYLENDKIRLGTTATNVYERAITLCLENHQEGDSLLHHAFYFSERNKGMVLFSDLKGRTNHINSTIPKALLESERNLKKEQHRFRQLVASTNDSLRKLDYQEQLHQVITSHQELMDYLKESHPDYYQLKYQEKIAPPEEVQKELGPDKALIEYFLNDKSLFVFTLTHQELWLDTLSLTDSLDSRLNTFQHQLQAPPDPDMLDVLAYNELATELYRLLLDKPLSHLPADIQSLVIVPDGELAQLNFGTLVKPGPSNETVSRFSQLPYVIKDYDLHYAASANLWVESIKQTSEANHHARYAFGGFAPAYDSLPGKEERWPDMLASLVRAGEVQLPGAEKEVQEIAEIMDGDAWLGAEATASRFREKAPEYSVVHLAMHALLDDQEPLNSCLVFSPYTETRTERDTTGSNNPETDYLLYASDIYSMQLPNRMAVLSACNTGRGQIKKGEGVMSLSRAFMYAGCPTQTISLWNVSDLASSTIMVQFYEYLADGLSVDASLRNAQLHYLNNSGHPVYSHPYYWASFITIGDSSPIAFRESRAITVIAFGLGLLLVMGIGIVLYKKQMKK
ncbi:CHAT domain-containing protein [Fulvivirga sp. M361]|uniref:CHAT domain-containing protein n=1 Tax=Fulvivirga sp. M361 TaxID=2594266 RepID=UPI001623714B|nr:CHAT domain-containing protein [Fulvivirga sp. M361]